MGHAYAMAREPDYIFRPDSCRTGFINATTPLVHRDTGLQSTEMNASSGIPPRPSRSMP